MVLAVSLNELSQVLVLGVVNGAVYSLIAIGLVLVYKASGVFNFAQGEFGTVAIYGAYFSTTIFDLPYLVGIVIGLVAAVATGLLTERFIIRPLFDAPRVTLLVATAGIALLAIGVQFWRTANSPLRFFDSIVKGQEGLARVSPFGIAVSDQDLITLFVLAVAAVALYVFFRSALGLAVLASSQEPVASELVGVSVRRISTITWGLAALLGGAAGLLYAGGAQFSPGLVTGAVLIPGFTAAIVGGITSLPGAAAGGILVGVLQALGGLSTFDSIKGASFVSVFIVLLAVLLIRPQGLFASRT
ncbi:MAG: branched-chain amino acid ABC transporter permease [Acidimicrobiales bacterium]